MLRLQSYNYNVSCVRSRDNIADALFRLPKEPPTRQYRHDDEHVHSLIISAVRVAMNIQEIERASSADEELQVVKKCLISGSWDQAPKVYLAVQNELTCIGQVILRGIRIVMPSALRKRVTELAHKSHQGIRKTMERLRSKVWWLGIDRDAERKCR